MGGGKRETPATVKNIFRTVDNGRRRETFGTVDNGGSEGDHQAQWRIGLEQQNRGRKEDYQAVWRIDLEEWIMEGGRLPGTIENRFGRVDNGGRETTRHSGE